MSLTNTFSIHTTHKAVEERGGGDGLSGQNLELFLTPSLYLCSIHFLVRQLSQWFYGVVLHTWHHSRLPDYKILDLYDLEISYNPKIPYFHVKRFKARRKSASSYYWEIIIWRWPNSRGSSGGRGGVQRQVTREEKKVAGKTV